MSSLSSVFPNLVPIYGEWGKMRGNIFSKWGMGRKLGIFSEINDAYLFFKHLARCARVFNQVIIRDYPGD